MDLELYARVIWRFRLLVVGGLFLAGVIALLTVVRVSTDGLSYREPERWSSTSRLLITQKGFPWGRAVPEEVDATERAKELGIVRFAAPDRFVSLAVLYSNLVTSDPVQQVLRRSGPIRGRIEAGPVYTQQQYALPLVDVVAITTDPRTALKLSERATRAIRIYLEEQQEAAAIAPENRVIVQTLTKAKKAILFEGRSYTLAIVAFLTVIMAAIGLAFILENLRPRIATAASPVEARVAGRARRSA